VIADEGGPEVPEDLERQQPAAEPDHEPLAAEETPANAVETPADAEETPADAEETPTKAEQTSTKPKPRKRGERRSPSRAKKGAAAEAAKDGSDSERQAREAGKREPTPEGTAQSTGEVSVEAAAPGAQPAGQSVDAGGPGADAAGASTEAAGGSAAAQPGADAAPAAETSSQEAPPDQARAPRAKPEVPGAHLEVDIVPEGVDPLGRERGEDPYAIGYEEDVEEPQGQQPEPPAGEVEEELGQPIVSAAIDLAAGARYRATGKRKTAVARVILRPGGGSYTINGRALQDYFPRATLQRNICQPLEAVGYQDRMDVLARLHGGGVSSQAGALRHGISRALLEADPSLRGELKRRGFLTRDSRVKERKKAGLKKARKRPQFSKR
jgi:small subunit ribosomal protein S9